MHVLTRRYDKINCGAQIYLRRQLLFLYQTMKLSKLFLPLTLGLLCAASVGAATLFPVGMGGRWGYADKSGKIIVNPQFDRAEVFSGNLAAAKLDKWGYVDNTGHFLINPQFDDATMFS